MYGFGKQLLDFSKVVVYGFFGKGRGFRCRVWCLVENQEKSRKLKEEMEKKQACNLVLKMVWNGKAWHAICRENSRPIAPRARVVGHQGYNRKEKMTHCMLSHHLSQRLVIVFYSFGNIVIWSQCMLGHEFHSWLSEKVNCRSKPWQHHYG